MLTISRIDDCARLGNLPAMSDADLDEAGHAVLFARDPAWLGEEPHLRCDVDPCGLDDDRLCEIEQEIWAEKGRRQSDPFIENPRTVLRMAA